MHIVVAPPLFTRQSKSWYIQIGPIPRDTLIRVHTACKCTTTVQSLCVSTSTSVATTITIKRSSFFVCFHYFDSNSSSCCIYNEQEVPISTVETTPIDQQTTTVTPPPAAGFSGGVKVDLAADGVPLSVTNNPSGVSAGLPPKHRIISPGDFEYALDYNSFILFQNAFGVFYQATESDYNMCFALVQKAAASLNHAVHADYRASLQAFEARCKGLRFGYVPGVIRHYYHGTKLNRKYNSRWKILVKYQYEPTLHIQREKKWSRGTYYRMPTGAS